MATWNETNTPKYDIQKSGNTINNGTAWKEKLQRGLGLNYPYSNGQQGMFTSTYTTIDNERVKLLNLLSTIAGERLMHPDFGLDLEQHLFEQITPDMKKIITQKVQSKIEFWLKNIVVSNLVVDVQSVEDRNSIYIEVSFYLVQNPQIGTTVTFII